MIDAQGKEVATRQTIRSGEFSFDRLMPGRYSLRVMLDENYAFTADGGESAAIFNERYLDADGIENCIRVLEQIDNEDIHNLDYVELNACSGGCVGGSIVCILHYFAVFSTLSALRLSHHFLKVKLPFKIHVPRAIR